MSRVDELVKVSNVALGAVLNGLPRRGVELGRVLPYELLGRALVGCHQIPDFLERCERL